MMKTIMEAADRLAREIARRTSRVSWVEKYNLGEVKEHDYTTKRRGWGHDRVLRPVPGTNGHQANCTGWGYGMEAGDVIMFTNDEGGVARYRIEQIEYYRDPRDMWRARLQWYPMPLCRDPETGMLKSEDLDNHPIT
jgi:hypothetical protein